ncbi:hypothetical protein GQ457_07G007770 [Hibiscus cannabinus]
MRHLEYEQACNCKEGETNGRHNQGRALTLERSHTSETAEACAFMDGVNFAIENNWQQFILEGDAINIEHKLANSGLDLTIPVVMIPDNKLVATQELKYTM